MQLRYKIEYYYDYADNSVIVILSSPYMQKEYKCPSISNVAAVMNAAITDFNEMHQHKIEELKNEEAYEKAKDKRVETEKAKGR